MIVILRRADLKVNELPSDKIRLHHTLLPRAAIDATDMIVYTEGGKVYILHATNWPLRKPMSAAEFYRYIAEHAV
jgi:hypothetical protein